jgi:hypothetical protein
MKENFINKMRGSDDYDSDDELYGSTSTPQTKSSLTETENKLLSGSDLHEKIKNKNLKSNSDKSESESDFDLPGLNASAMEENQKKELAEEYKKEKEEYIVNLKELLRNDSKTEEPKDEVTINTKKNRNIEYEEH